MVWHDDGKNGSKIIEVGALRERILNDDPKPRLVDARPAAQYREGHLPGAINLDVNLLQIPTSDDAVVQKALMRMRDALGAIGIQPNDHVVAYEDYSGVSAARAVWMLDLLGVGSTSMLDGGIAAWMEAGGEVTQLLPATVPRPFDAPPRLDLLATTFDLVPAISSDPTSVQVLDTRSALEHRMGTIPTAVHVEWMRNLGPDGRFLPRAELEKLYREAGFDPGNPLPIVTFCGSGFRAAHSYLVLTELGFRNVQNYAPSWHEWGSRSDLPIERDQR